MPVFTALMSSAFGPQDPFNALVRNDRTEDDKNVRVLPVWVAETLERDLQFRQIVL
jgi:hypothetical protein